MLESALAGRPDAARIDQAAAACVEAGVGAVPAVAAARRVALQMRQEAVVARLNGLLQVRPYRTHLGPCLAAYITPI